MSLESFGRQLQSLESFGKQTIVVGPWGGQDGFYWDDGVHTAVRQFEISHGTAIDSIRIEYDDFGKSVWSEKRGGNGGFKIDKVKLHYPDEFLTSLHGHYGSLHEFGQGAVIIRSLTLVSNKRAYGPFGVEQGVYFTVPQMSGKIVGFLGKSGWYLDAVGVYVDPIHIPSVTNAVYRSQQHVAHGAQERFEYSMIQGSIGPNYDLVVAVRQKDAPTSHHPSDPVRQKDAPKIHHLSDPLNRTSHDFSLLDSKNEIPMAAPRKIERASPINVEGVVTYGPWGGSGGSLFDDGVYDGVRQIKVYRHVGIVSIGVCYDLNGQAIWRGKNGSKGVFKSNKIIFDYPSEILTHVTGYFGPTMIMGPNAIKSLCFHTTKATYGPFGEQEGEPFSSKLKEGSMVVGFHGRRGLLLDSIGVHVLEGKVEPNSSTSNTVVSSASNSNPKMSAPNPVAKVSNQTSVASHKAENSQWTFKLGKKGQSDEVGNPRLVKDPAPYGPGPWGGEGGKPWDDGVFTGIKQIILTRTNAISCIEIEYDRNGQSVWSVKHGGATGQTAQRVKLDYPDEVVTSISGYYGPIKNAHGGETRVIHSLSFHSSRKMYGPFGEEIGTYFASGTTQGKVVGFHGRSSAYLDAIGVHMQHWLGNHRTHKHPSLMKIFS